MKDCEQVLNERRQRLAAAKRRWEKRSGAEKAVVDEGFMTPLVLCCVLLIWAVELTANVRSGVTGWIAVSHLLIIGSLASFLGGFLLFALLRKWSRRRQLTHAEEAYRSLIARILHE